MFFFFFLECFESQERKSTVIAYRVFLNPISSFFISTLLEIATFSVLIRRREKKKKGNRRKRKNKHAYNDSSTSKFCFLRSICLRTVFMYIQLDIGVLENNTRGDCTGQRMIDLSLCRKRALVRSFTFVHFVDIWPSAEQQLFFIRVCCAPKGYNGAEGVTGMPFDIDLFGKGNCTLP